MADEDHDLSELSEQLMPWERNFRDQMVRLRKERGLTQTDLARQLAAWGLPFHQQTIQRVENGQRPIRLNEAKLVARQLGVDLETMVSTASVSSRDMMRAVDEARRGAAKFAEVVGEELGDLANSTARLILLVGELIEHHSEDSAPDPALVYGFTWANHFWDLYVHSSEALTQALQIEEGRDTAHGYVFPEFEAMRDWFDTHDHLFRLTDEYPRFPERDDADT